MIDQTAVTFGSQLNGILSVNSASPANRGSVIISHGAGRGLDASLLVRTAEALAERRFAVLRFNFGYLGKRGAPSAGGAKELPELLSAIEYMAPHGAPILIGKSFGARVAANAAASRKDIRACVFYGMPLQGASPTAKPRDWSHLKSITCPMLFITGDRDSLCPLERLAEVIAPINAPVDSEVIPGDHSYKPKSEQRAAEICLAWIDHRF